MPYTYRREAWVGATREAAVESAMEQAVMSNEAQVIYRLVPVAIVRPPIPTTCTVVDLETK